MANPFKVGDKVQRKDSRTGEVLTVSDVDGQFIAVKCNPLFDHYENYKPWKHPEEIIVIKTDGEKTTAYLKRDGKVVNEAKLRKHPDDKHDLKVLAGVAVQRLLPDDGREIGVRVKGYHGAVAVTAISSFSTMRFKPGLIMEFFGGKWKDASIFSVLSGLKFDSYAELAKYMESKGVRIVELHRNA